MHLESSVIISGRLPPLRAAAGVGRDIRRRAGPAAGGTAGAPALFGLSTRGASRWISRSSGSGTSAGIHIEQLYFTGQVFGGVKTRVYAYRAAPWKAAACPASCTATAAGRPPIWTGCASGRGAARRASASTTRGDTNKYNLPEYVREHFTKWGTAVDKMIADRPSRTRHRSG